MWEQSSGDALKFAQAAILHRIGPEIGDLIQRNIEYDLEISDIYPDSDEAETGKLVVSISCGGCGYLMARTVAPNTSFRRSRKPVQSDQGKSKAEFDLRQIEYRRLLGRYREGRYGSWIRRLRRIERLSRIKTKAQDPSEYSHNYDGPPLPALLVVFEDHDAIAGCFDEESQRMLEASSEPTVCAVFSPTSMEEFSDAVRIVERFVRSNEELCRLIEEIQSREKQNEDRNIDRRGASLRAA